MTLSLPVVQDLGKHLLDGELEHVNNIVPLLKAIRFEEEVRVT
jgi:hypothetical protein